jgi:GTP cyclohydrolase I
MAEQVATHLDERLSPSGVIVVLRARHLCMEMRGIETQGTTTTVAVRGVLEDQRLQEQFFTRLRAVSRRAGEEA